jgi:hypothetical protein
VLAQSTNIGTYSRTQAAFIPEAVVNLGYRVTPWATVTVGYNFVYVSEMVRPGNQIDTVINTSNFPFSGSSSDGHRSHSAERISGYRESTSA